MTQVFRPRANLIAYASIVLLLTLMAAGAAVAIGLSRSSYNTGLDIEIAQPVPFSHAHHVAGLGIDCRYCHTAVEDSPFAGMPSTDTCMNCHWQLWTEADLLAPVRRSAETGEPIPWRRVHNLPDFVYFNHSIHVQKGIGCATCHGQVDEMPLMRKAERMTMAWCLDCHREPERYVRPRNEVFNMDWQRPEDDDRLGRRLVERYHIPTAGLTNCTTCHR